MQLAPAETLAQSFLASFSKEEAAKQVVELSKACDDKKLWEAVLLKVLNS